MIASKLLYIRLIHIHDVVMDTRIDMYDEYHVDDARAMHGIYVFIDFLPIEM